MIKYFRFVLRHSFERILANQLVNLLLQTKELLLDYPVKLSSPIRADEILLLFKKTLNQN